MFTSVKNGRARGLTAGLLAGLALACLVATAAAGPGKPRTAGGKARAGAKEPEPQKVSNEQLREALHVLQLTKKTLEGADHDYGGHRVEAIKAIGAAQKQLHLALETQTGHKKPAHPAKGSGTTGKTGKGKGQGKEPEPQNISNFQLKEAAVVLKKTVAHLEKADHDYGGHRVHAIRDLNVAIEQLHKALQYEKKNGEK